MIVLDGTIGIVIVTLEPLSYGSFGLAHILFLALEARDQIDQVGTFATDIVFTRMFLTSGMTGEFACFVYLWAISAFFVFAYIGS